MTEQDPEEGKVPGRVSEAIDAASQLLKAVPVYQDSIQPAAREIGKGLETVAKTVNMAMAPLKGLVWGYEQIENFLTERLANKLKDVPEEKIVTPPTNVVIPAIEALKYAGYDELREMYASLIASSMNKETRNQVHPAFVEIIKQLSPEEAEFLKNVDNHVPLIHQLIISDSQVLGRSITIAESYFFPFMKGDGTGMFYFHELSSISLDNLDRLGLISLIDLTHEEYLGEKIFFSSVTTNEKEAISNIKKRLKTENFDVNFRYPRFQLKTIPRRAKGTQLLFRLNWILGN